MQHCPGRLKAHAETSPHRRSCLSSVPMLALLTFSMALLGLSLGVPRGLFLAGRFLAAPPSRHWTRSTPGTAAGEYHIAALGPSSEEPRFSRCTSVTTFLVSRAHYTHVNTSRYPRTALASPSQIRESDRANSLELHFSLYKFSQSIGYLTLRLIHRTGLLYS